MGWAAPGGAASPWPQAASGMATMAAAGTAPDQGGEGGQGMASGGAWAGSGRRGAGQEPRPLREARRWLLHQQGQAAGGGTQAAGGRPAGGFFGQEPSRPSAGPGSGQRGDEGAAVEAGSLGRPSRGTGNPLPRARLRLTSMGGADTPPDRRAGVGFQPHNAHGPAAAWTPPAGGTGPWLPPLALWPWTAVPVGMAPGLPLPFPGMALAGTPLPGPAGAAGLGAQAQDGQAAADGGSATGAQQEAGSSLEAGGSARAAAPSAANAALPLAQAYLQLRQDMEDNLRKLRQVISESQAIAQQMEQLLSATPSPSPQSSQGKEAHEGADLRGKGNGGRHHGKDSHSSRWAG